MTLHMTDQADERGWAEIIRSYPIERPGDLPEHARLPTRTERVRCASLADVALEPEPTGLPTVTQAPLGDLSAQALCAYLGT